MNIWQFILFCLWYFLSQLWLYLWWLYLALTCYFLLIYLLAFNILLGFMVRMLKTWDSALLFYLSLGWKALLLIVTTSSILVLQSRLWIHQIHGPWLPFFLIPKFNFYILEWWLFIFLIFFFIYLSYFDLLMVNFLTLALDLSSLCIDFGVDPNVCCDNVGSWIFRSFFKYQADIACSVEGNFFCFILPFLGYSIEFWYFFRVLCGITYFITLKNYCFDA